MTKQDYRDLITNGTTWKGYRKCDRFGMFIGIGLCAVKEHGSDFFEDLQNLYYQQFPKERFALEGDER